MATILKIQNPKGDDYKIVKVTFWYTEKRIHLSQATKEFIWNAIQQGETGNNYFCSIYDENNKYIALDTIKWSLLNVHTTVGVYNNNDFVINGVAPEHLKYHIEYNQKMRFGRALFVDGVCVNKGYLDDKRIKEWTDKIHKKEQFIMEVCNAPYK